MKTVSIHLTQEPSPGLFRITRFTNTVQLSVGMLVKADKVEEWCCIPRVNVFVDGLTQPNESEQPLLESGSDIRSDPLAIPGEV